MLGHLATRSPRTRRGARWSRVKSLRKLPINHLAARSPRARRGLGWVGSLRKLPISHMATRSPRAAMAELRHNLPRRMIRFPPSWDRRRWVAAEQFTPFLSPPSPLPAHNLASVPPSPALHPHGEDQTDCTAINWWPCQSHRPSTIASGPSIPEIALAGSISLPECCSRYRDGRRTSSRSWCGGC